MSHGVFDEYYNPGYGEECDYSLRIRLSGFDIACAPASFVYHMGSQSFTEDSNILKSQHQRLLDLRWPKYSEEIQTFSENNPIKLVEEYLHLNNNKDNILHVVHGLESKGGVELFTKTILEKTEKNIFNTVLVLSQKKIPYQTLETKKLNNKTRILYYQYINHKVYTKINNRNADMNHQELDLMFTRLILNGRYKCIHFHSFVGIGSLMWPLICHSLGIPYIISCHDHFSICFNFSLLTNKNTRYCEKTQCIESDIDCVNCLKQITNYNPLSTKNYIQKRNSIWHQIIENSATIIAPSKYLHDILLNNFQNIEPKNIHIVEPYFHPKKKIHIPVTTNKNLCVAFLGTFSYEKGAQIFLDSYHELKSLGINWQIIGQIEPFYHQQLNNTTIKCSGIYQQDDLTNLLSNIDLVIIPAIQPETYCRVLSEAWANNIPVIASDIGALKARIKPGFNGMTFSNANPMSLASCIEGLEKNRGTLIIMKNNLQTAKLPNVDSSDAINHIYSQYTEKHCKSILPQNTTQKPLSTPSDNAYQTMQTWLSSEMTLEAESDWKSPKDIDIIILGKNQKLCSQSEISCQSYAPNSKVYLPYFDKNFDFNNLTPVFCILFEGQLINDNFGNWIDNFQISGKYIGLTDYALINNHEQIYGPQFESEFNEFSYLRRKNRIGALICNMPIEPCRIKGALNQIIKERLPFSHVIDTLIDDNMFDKIHYFPYLSYLYNDVLWSTNWKTEIQNNNMSSLVLNQKTSDISIILLSNLNQEKIQIQIRILMKQRKINIAHIYVFSSHRVIFNQENVSAHYVDFNQPDIYINPVLQRDRATQLLFLNDNIILNDKNVLNTMSKHIEWKGIQAISPIFNSTVNNDYIVAEKIGKGHLSGRGILRDVRFDVGNFPYISSLLDEDCFLINKTSWNLVKGFNTTGNVYYRANALSNQLCKTGHRIALIPVTGIAKTNLPSYCMDTKSIELNQQRKDLINSDKKFYLNNKDTSKAFDSQDGIQLDVNFGTFKTPKNLPRVLAYANDSWASGFYRVKAPISAMVAADKISSHFLPERRQNRTASYFEIIKQSPNVLLLHNFLDTQQLSALKLYRKYLDIPLVLSLDDLLTEIPNYNQFSKSNPKDIQSKIKTALKLVDRLIVTTEYLADKFSHLHKNIKVINNLLPKELWLNQSIVKNQNKKLRIGWAGAAQHEKDLAWLKPIISATKNQVQWVFYGYLPDNLGSHFIEFHKNTSFANYHSTLGALQLDIAIAPLVSNTFNRAKSNLKLLEYGALGLPTICSAIDSYKNSPAIQLKNEPKIWIKTILELISNEEKRLELSRDMKFWVYQNYFLEDNLNLWFDALYLNNE